MGRTFMRAGLSRAMAASITVRSSLAPRDGRGRRRERPEHGKPLEADPVQPAQFAERVRVVVGADVEIGVGVVPAMHPHGGALPAPLVAARILPGLQRRDQADARAGRMAAAKPCSIASSTAAPASMLPATERFCAPSRCPAHG